MQRLLTVLALSIGPLSGALAQGGAPPVSYHREIRPILQKRCQGCHQPASQGGKLVVTSYEAFRAGGAAGASFKPGRPDESIILRYITGNPPPMPKNQKPLSAGEVGLFKRWIAEGAKDDTPRQRDPIDQQNPPVYAAPPVTSALAFSPDGRWIAVSGFREVLLHRADGSGLEARLVGKSPRIESLAFSPDGKVLAAVGGSPALFGEVQLWDVEKRALKQSVQLGYDTLFGASFSPDGARLACGAADNSVRIVNVADGKLLLKFDNHSDWTFSTTWTTDNKHILSTGRDQAVKLIVAENGSFIDDINTHTSPFRAMARDPRRDNVLVAGDDGIPRLYQVFRTKARTMNQEDHNLLRAYERQPGRVNSVAFSPDGLSFAVAGEYGEIRVYSTDDGKRLTQIPSIPGVTFSLAFRADGKRLAAGGQDGQVRLFDIPSGAQALAFTPVPIRPRAAAR
jgi:hypothetical protein